MVVATAVKVTGVFGYTLFADALMVTATGSVIVIVMAFEFAVVGVKHPPWAVSVQVTISPSTKQPLV